MTWRDINYEETSQVGRISKEHAKDFVEHVLEQQIEDVESCSYYDQWDGYFEFELTPEEEDFIWAVDRRASAKVVVTWP